MLPTIPIHHYLSSCRPHLWTPPREQQDVKESPSCHRDQSNCSATTSNNSVTGSEQHSPHQSLPATVVVTSHQHQASPFAKPDTCTRSSDFHEAHQRRSSFCQATLALPALSRTSHDRMPFNARRPRQAQHAQCHSGPPPPVATLRTTTGVCNLLRKAPHLLC